MSDNPCELHQDVKAHSFCPICLVNERDALKIYLREALLEGYGDRDWREAVSQVIEHDLPEDAEA